MVIGSREAAAQRKCPEHTCFVWATLPLNQQDEQQDERGERYGEQEEDEVVAKDDPEDLDRWPPARPDEVPDGRLLEANGDDPLDHWRASC